MKFIKKLAFVLSLIILMGILAGCTPKTGNPGESTTQPGAQNASGSQPEQGSQAQDPSSGHGGAAGTESGSPSEGEQGSTMPEPDEGGLEVETGYDYVIDDDLGIGGN